MWDRHYHEFEDWQLDWLLEKTGWKIIDSQKWTNRKNLVSAIIALPIDITSCMLKGLNSTIDEYQIIILAFKLKRTSI
jgi:hypothetical protein